LSAVVVCSGLSAVIVCSGFLQWLSAVMVVCI